MKVNVFYKESKSKKKNNIYIFIFFCGGVGRVERGGGRELRK